MFTLSERGGSRFGLGGGTEDFLADDEVCELEGVEEDELEFCAQTATVRVSKKINSHFRITIFYIPR
jgi:hypothetical protein